MRSGRELHIPQGILRWNSLEKREERCSGAPVLLVCGGREPEGDWLSQAAEGRWIVAVDRGADMCRRSGLVPRHFLGDCDSASSATLAWLEELEVPRRLFPRDKDLTDYQLALKFLGMPENMPESVLVTGIWGGRWDHLYSALFSARTFLETPFSGGLVYGDHGEMLLFLRGGEEAELFFPVLPEAFSLLPLSPVCRGVWSRGTRWNLEGAELRQGLPYAVSNRIVEGTSCAAGLEEGMLGVYATWNK